MAFFAMLSSEKRLVHARSLQLYFTSKITEQGYKMTVKGKMEESSFQALLKTLCRERFRLYDLYRAGQLERKEYLEKIQPLDKAVDRLELSLLGEENFCRARD